MRQILGIIFMVLGFATMILGGLGIFIYYLYELVVNFEVMTRSEVFWAILMMIFRDFIPIIVGFVFIGIGFLLNDE